MFVLSTVKQTLYRVKNPDSPLGEPGPLQGVNTGVVMLDLKKMRLSKELAAFLQPDRIDAACEKLDFRSYFGDQDWWNMVVWSSPHLRYDLDCGFNYQVRSQDFNNELMDEV